MKKSKVLLLLLAGLVSLSVFTGCKKDDKKDEETTVAETTVADTVAPDGEETEDPAVQTYLDTMSTLITSYEGVRDTMIGLLSIYDGTEEWFASYTEGYQLSGEFANQLTTMLEQTPEDYKESHGKIALAMAAYTDCFDTMGTVTNAQTEEEANELIAQATQLADAANTLWAESIE